jgi:hypothetical protein
MIMHHPIMHLLRAMIHALHVFTTLRRRPRCGVAVALGFGACTTFIPGGSSSANT